MRMTLCDGRCIVTDRVVDTVLSPSPAYTYRWCLRRPDGLVVISLSDTAAQALRDSWRRWPTGRWAK